MRSPACAASGWLATTIPCRAMTSDRVWASQPPARSPRTAAQNAGFGVESHDTIASERDDCASMTVARHTLLTAATIAALARVITPRPSCAAVGDREAPIDVRA